MSTYAIQPFPGTYLSILPRELRAILYNYKNSLNMTYTFRTGMHDEIYLYIDINKRPFTTITFDKIYMKNFDTINNIDAFIDFISQEMTGYLSIEMQSDGVDAIDINDIQSLTEFTYFEMSLETYKDDRKNTTLSRSSIPLCIQLIELLRELRDMLK